MTDQIPYLRRRTMRRMEKVWNRLEAGVDRFTEVVRNPMYHTGTLAIFLLVVIAVTGVYLTIFYRPGAEKAFESVAGMTDTWLGSLNRTVHRYASGALLVVALLHALKSLLRDQTRGPRWLAWVSGWVLVVLVWIIVVMGYWLVADKSAQWITEWAMGFGKGRSVITFVGPEVIDKTFMFYVIVLFLHIFLSILVIFWLLLHVIRSSMVRIWAPRWLMVGSAALLAAISVLRPAGRGDPSNMHTLVEGAELDHWFLGFLPLVDRLGNGIFWLGTAVIFGTMLLAPWILRGPKVKPVVISADACNGNGRCVQACPYGALELVRRDDDETSNLLAEVDPKLCTACGLCVGVCPTDAIHAPDMPVEAMREGVRLAVAEAASNGASPAVAYICARHWAMGEPYAIGDGLDRVTAGANPADDEGTLVRAMVTCSGMLNSRWVREAVDAGAEDIVAVACPTHDCRFQHGSEQLDERLERGWIRAGDVVQKLEASPGERRSFLRLLRRSSSDDAPGSPDESPPRRRLGHTVGFALVLALLVALPAYGVRNSSPIYPSDGALRVAFVHGGEFQDPSDGDGFGGQISNEVTPGQVVGLKRLPVGLRVIVDGETIHDRSYNPAGLRNNGLSSAVETLWIGFGTYDVEVWINDDGASWEQVYQGRAVIDPGRIVTLHWDERSGEFLPVASTGS